MPTPLDLAASDMTVRAEMATDTDAALGFRHAAQLTRNAWDTPRTLLQLRRHARFYRESNPVKAHAYREAIAILTHHTGETAAADIVRESYAQGDLALTT